MNYNRPSLTDLGYSPSTRHLEGDIPSGPLRAFALRIYRGQNFVEELSKSAGKVMRSCAPNAFILSCNGNLGLVEIEVGRATNSLHKLKKIMEKDPYEENEGQREVVRKEEKGHVIAFEDAVQIVSLTGVFSQTVDDYNTPTVHSNLTICISDINGRVRSGQLISGFVLNSVELVLGCIEGTEFERKYSPNTDQDELYVNEFDGRGSDDEEANNIQGDEDETEYGDDQQQRTSPPKKEKKKRISVKKPKSNNKQDERTKISKNDSKKKSTSASKKRN